MELNLTETPKDVTILQGFPGFGMVGSISTEFLLKHLDTKQIGSVKLKEMTPVLAIHDGEVVPPVGIYYNKKNNLVILNFLTKGNNHEWDLADLVKQLAEKFKAKEIIAIEGVTSQMALKDQQVFVYSKKKIEGFERLNEGIIMGVSAALLLEKLPCSLTAFFSMTASTLPDSNAAAEIIKALDKYLGLEVDYNPLYEQAKEFEEKIKGILSKSQQALDEKERSMLNYVS